jgi:hypothetical protein
LIAATRSTRAHRAAGPHGRRPAAGSIERRWPPAAPSARPRRRVGRRELSDCEQCLALRRLSAMRRRTGETEVTRSRRQSCQRRPWGIRPVNKADFAYLSAAVDVTAPRHLRPGLHGRQPVRPVEQPGRIRVERTTRYLSPVGHRQRQDRRRSAASIRSASHSSLRAPASTRTSIFDLDLVTTRRRPKNSAEPTGSRPRGEIVTRSVP